MALGSSRKFDSFPSAPSFILIRDSLMLKHLSDLCHQFDSDHSRRMGV